MIITQFVQKEKPAGKRSSAGYLYTLPEYVYSYSELVNKYIIYPAFYQCFFLAGSLSPSGCNVSALQCPAAEAAQHTAKELSFGLPSQAVRF